MPEARLRHILTTHMPQATPRYPLTLQPSGMTLYYLCRQRLKL